jgi:integrase
VSRSVATIWRAEFWHIKEPERLPPVLSPEEVKRVLTMAMSLKARAMLTLAYGCGLRAGEVVRLRVGDIDSAQMIIRIVQSKGRKDRHVMLPPEVLKLLRQWWKERPTGSDADVAPEHRWLFPGRSHHQPLTTRQFGRLFKEAANAARLRKSVSLHSLRHSFATQSARARQGYSSDSGVARTREAGLCPAPNYVPTRSSTRLPRARTACERDIVRIVRGY